MNQNNLGSALWFARDYRGSAEVHRQGIATYSELLKANPSNLEARDGLAECQVNLGNALWAAGDLAGAAESYRRAIADWDSPHRSRSRGRPISGRPRPGFKNNLGQAFKAIAASYEEATGAFRQAVNHGQLAFNKAPHVQMYRQFLSESNLELSRCLTVLGRTDEAVRIIIVGKVLWENNPGELYDAVCELALCVPLVQKTEAKQAVAVEAVQTLKQAIAAGWNNADHTTATRI